MYETTDALFAGICDEIRAKDGTTALIRHQDIPARIAAINGESGGVVFTSPFYTYRGSGLKLENMVASNFSESSAIFIEEAFLPGNDTWEIGVKFTLPQKTKVYHALFGTGVSGTDFCCPTVSIETYSDKTRIVAGISKNGNNWDYFGTYDLTDTTDQWYYLKFKFDGEKYVVSFSEDGQIFDDIIQFDYSVMYQNANKSKISFGGVAMNNHYFGGSIDLKETYIEIGEKIWWGGNKGHEEV